MELTRHQLNELKDQVEDSVAYICDLETISGEAAWKIIEGLATLKIAEMQGLLTLD